MAQRPADPVAARQSSSSIWAGLALIVVLLSIGAVIGYAFARHSIYTGRFGDVLQHWGVPLAFVGTAAAALLSARTAVRQARILERTFQSQGGPLLTLTLGQEEMTPPPKDQLLIHDELFTQHCGAGAQRHRVCYVYVRNVQPNASGVAFDVWVRCTASVPRRGTSGERDGKAFWVGPFTVPAQEKQQYMLFDLGDAQDFVVEIDSVEYVDLYGEPINRAYGDCHLSLTNTGEIRTKHRVLAPRDSGVKRT